MKNGKIRSVGKCQKKTLGKIKTAEKIPGSLKMLGKILE